MIDTLNKSFRVLIVDDEFKNWTKPMKEALEYEVKERGFITKLQIDIAEDKHQAEAFLEKYNYHVTSLDMRLPERKGELVSVNPGLSLAKKFPWIGFPKLLVYSQLLRKQQFIESPNDAIQVLQLPADLYAKPTGSDADQEQDVIETLTVKEWAKRVAESLFTSDTLEIKVNEGYGKRYNVIGAYLHYGVKAIPTFLASHLQTLANHWTDRTSDRVDAAIAFIEATIRLAFVQSAVLYQAQGNDLDLPYDDRMLTCLNSLEIIRKRLSGWNWCNYLTVETLQAFHQARRERNEKVHSNEPNDPQKRWAKLYSPLLYAMDLAAYWVRHPLVIDLRYSRDGWSGVLLAGTAANPLPRHSLPQAMEFPFEAIQSSGAWQNVWRLSCDGKDELELKTLPWEHWLIPDPNTSAHWWFPICEKGHGKVHIDMITGRKRTLP